MATALKILSDEHKNILKVIDSMLKECDSLKSGKEINSKFFKSAIKFVREYADKFHHLKEEDILFVEMCKDPTQMHCNPTEQMLFEHEMGRNFIKELEKGVEEKNKDKIIENARGYSSLLQEHISKEDNILYPLANQALNQATKKEMLEKFKQIEKKFTKEKDNYLSFVSSLSKK